MLYNQSPLAVVAIPLLAAFIVNIVGQFNKKYCFHVTVFALFISFTASLDTLHRVLDTGVISYHIGGWVPPIGIEYVIDHLNALVLVVVTFVGFISVVYSKRIVPLELPDCITQFYTLYLLVMTGLLGITITGDAFNLYVLLEIASLSAYGLIAVYRGKAILSSFNYLIMGTVGASFYLLGIGHLYIMTGSLNMADLHKILPALYDSNAILIAFILILVGVWIKMAFFPVHEWLPNAYTNASSSTSCLIAPLMTKVSVYIMIRVMFSVFGDEFVFEVLTWHNVIVWCAVVAIIAGSVMALAQTDFKRMLTYIIIAEVGYMVGGVWLANGYGLTGAILHILNDALMTLCLFFVAGIVAYKLKNTALVDMKGIYRKMPVTMAAFTVGALSMIGVPPTCGFFSKWYLILGAIEAGKWWFMAALIFSSLVNIVLFFRVIEIGYFEPFQEHHHETVQEAPAIMLAPLYVVAVGLVIVGVFSRYIVTDIIRFALPAGLGL